jgi:hypothetical protein
MRGKMEKNNAKPELLLADSGYGSGENVIESPGQGVELFSPTSDKDADKIGLEECELDENNRIIRCPLGKKTLKKAFKNGVDNLFFYFAEILLSLRIIDSG